VLGPALACAACAISAVIDSVVLGLMTLIRRLVARWLGHFVFPVIAHVDVRSEIIYRVPWGRSSPASTFTLNARM